MKIWSKKGNDNLLTGTGCSISLKNVILFLSVFTCITFNCFVLCFSYCLDLYCLTFTCIYKVLILIYTDMLYCIEVFIKSQLKVHECLDTVLLLISEQTRYLSWKRGNVTWQDKFGFWRHHNTNIFYFQLVSNIKNNLNCPSSTEIVKIRSVILGFYLIRICKFMRYMYVRRWYLGF